MAYSVSALGEINPQMSMTETPTFKTSKRLVAFTGLLCCLSLAVVACGQRGPLYLPAKNAGTVNTEQAASEEEKTANKKTTEEDGIEDEETP